jgi:hypothetical protein
MDQRQPKSRLGKPERQRRLRLRRRAIRGARARAGVNRVTSDGLLEVSRRERLRVPFAAPLQPLLLARRPKLASLLMGPLVALSDLLSEIVEGLLCRRSPRAWFLTWRAWFLVLLWQRAALLFAPPGKVGHRKNGERGTQAVEAASNSTPRGSLGRSACVLGHLMATGVRVHQGESVAGSPAPERRRRAIRSSISPSHRSARPSTSSSQSSRSALSARTRWTVRIAWSISES